MSISRLIGFTGKISSALVVAFVLTLVAAHALASEDPGFTAVYKPTLEIGRTYEPIRIDGQLDDAGWQAAGVAKDFCEVSPGDMVRPPVRSAGMITYDDKNLYVALIAHDDPRMVRASLRDRDNIFQDDFFGIMFDTYGDASWAYEIFVNPLGLQGDLRMESNGNEDLSYDIVFESMGIVTDSGYQVELAIPFASLRFPDKPEQTWRMTFWRDHQREVRRRYSWAAQDRNEPCFPCQWGYLKGIRDIWPGKNLEIMPGIVASQSGALDDIEDPSSDFENGDPDAEASLNVRYGLSSNSSLELTLNPDFSQVESDAAQVNVNTNFGLFYSEARPFFQEGSDLFNTWINAVYTRTINDPVAAAKFTGQFGKARVAYLFARDENSTVTVPLQQQSIFRQSDKSIVNVLRAQQRFGDDSFVGMVFTDQRLEDFDVGSERYGGGSGTLFGIDGRFRLTQRYRIVAQALLSHTEEVNAPDLIDTTFETGRAQSHFDGGQHTVALDGEKFWGDAAYLGFIRASSHWDFSLEYRHFSPTFRAANGFENKTDYRNLEFWTGVTFRPNREWLIEWVPSLLVGRNWEYDGKFGLHKFGEGAFDEWIRGEVSFTFKGQTALALAYLNSQEIYAGKGFPGISRMSVNVSTRFSEYFSGGFSTEFGRTIRRYRQAPELGYQKNFSCYLNLKPTMRLYVSTDFDYALMDHLDGYMNEHPDEDRNIFKGYIVRSRLNYQFTRRLFLRLILQYDDFSEGLAVEPMVTYRVNPFTKFYIGMTSRHQYYDAADYESLSESDWKLGERQFFCKFQYLWRL